MTTLITGGCGFVGSNVAAALIGRGQRVVVLDDLSRHGSEKNLAWLRTLGAFEFIHGDVRVAAQVLEAVQRHRPAVVFHLAGQVAMTTSMAEPRRDFEINVVGSVNLLEAVRTSSPTTTIVYASSNKVYGDLTTVPLRELARRYDAPGHPEGVDESAPLDFQTPYGCSKGAADQYMLDYARVFGLNTVVFRHSTIYGGRQFATFDQGWVGWFCQQAAATRTDPGRAPFGISGDGKQVRDLLFVEDAVAAYLAAAERIETARGQVFNLGGGMANSSSLLELFAQLEGLTQVPLRWTAGPWRHSDQRFFVADIRKARRVLGWAPRVDKTTGVARMLEWTLALAAS
jgi:CDP-paratose 2-epimerase